MNHKIANSLDLMTKAKHLFSKVKVFESRKTAVIDYPIESEIRDRVFPIDAGLMTALEYAFDADLSDVRIHLGEEADRLTSQYRASAITIGRDIYFSGGMYEPYSAEGQKLLVHELKHVLQSKNGHSMVFVEDIAGLEADAERIENLLSDRKIEDLEKGELNNQSRYQRSKSVAGENGPLLKGPESNESSGTLEDMLEADRIKHIEYRLRSGEKIILTEKEYSDVVELSKDALMESLEEKKYSLTSEEYERELSKAFAYLKGAF
ncbi:MAG: DUF4157 domain-containing protein [Spirochaetales bacterium]|nr:DUF4157 domain-containing protein [Spirochaetales bacterium]